MVTMMRSLILCLICTVSFMMITVVNVAQDDILLPTPAPTDVDDEESIEIYLGASVRTNILISHDDIIVMRRGAPQTARTIRLVPGQEYVMHARSTGYLPVDQAVYVDESTTDIFIEMERDPNWITVFEWPLHSIDAISHWGYIRCLYEDGVAWGVFSGRRSPGKWYYYNPIEDYQELVEGRPCDLSRPDLPIETLEWLGVTQDAGGYLPIQTLPSGKVVYRGVFEGVNGYWLADLETGEMINLRL